MYPTVQYTQSCHRKLICLFFLAVQESWRQRFQQEDEGEALAKVLECCALEAQKDSCSRQDTSSSQPLDENTVKQKKTKKEEK